ncbi:hypothetical protein O2N63_15145 [Aliiroseovarius sp. KMU-50]|uniref:Uncharacterized protein n=1 Tax=Aliiroseovarius salicola TaxID=3009082 RepID=A0ABT4W4I3_9RHOB|nr:hypothetical protein [Aliiroseovarius sp. KMU-50]MDA5095423.1 hypothetical protein [Aliiroseovarius sp. KMU-50]
MKSLPNALVITAMMIGLSGPLSAENMMQSTTMHRFADLSIVEGASAELTRMDHGVYMKVKTSDLKPGHVVTMWWVVFNNPEKCSDNECGEDDVFNLNADGSFIFNEDGTPPMNMEAWKSIQLSLLRADGLIVGEDGTAEFRGHLPVGDTIEAVAGPGLLDSMKAEVHAVLRDHMEPKPEIRSEMLNSMNAGCSEIFPGDPCVDPQFAVFKPAN